MVKISRGNVVLDVDETFLQSYLNQGYNVVDATGNVIQRGTPNDVTSLKLALTEAENEIDKLNSKIKDMQKQIDNLNNQLKDSKKSTKNK